jgi:hypothetical protein
VLSSRITPGQLMSGIAPPAEFCGISTCIAW